MGAQRSDFAAHALYFLIAVLSCNVLASMRQLLPEGLAQHRAMTLCWRLYAMAAKVVKPGPQLFVKRQEKHRIRRFLTRLLCDISLLASYNT